MRPGLVLLSCIAQGALPGCPCLSSYPTSISSNMLTVVENTCLPLLSHISASTRCYQSPYGLVTCTAHDASTSECQSVDHPPSYCNSNWCYVDPSNCNLSHETSVYFGSGLSYSFETCGNFDSFTDLAANDSITEMINTVEGYVKFASHGLNQLRSDFIDVSEKMSSCTYQDSCSCSGCLLHVEGGGSHFGTASNTLLNFKEVDISWAGTDTSSYDSQDHEDVKCFNRFIRDMYLRLMETDFEDPMRAGYLYYGDSATGALVTWPASNFCPKNSGSNYDPRYRPWYGPVVTGPKDFILVIDRSGSMGDNQRLVQAVTAAKQLLLTLNWRDYVQIVAFSSGAQSFSTSTLRYDLLHPVTDENRDKMNEYLDSLFPGGGTNYQAAFDLTLSILQESTLMANSANVSGCQQNVLFLTDGQDTSDFHPSSFPAEIVVHTYQFGDDQSSKPKDIACSHKGVFHRVPDGGDLADTMSDYYGYIAAGLEQLGPRWVEYEDSISGETLVSACSPIYKGTTRLLLGVNCVDLNILLNINTFKASNPTKWDEFQTMYTEKAKECVVPSFTETQLEELRAAVGPESVCSSTSADYHSASLETNVGCCTG